jgi:hypothetical protein
VEPGAVSPGWLDGFGIDIMWHRFLRWITPLLILGFCSLPVVLAQGRVRGAQQEEVDSSSRSFPFAYTVALLGTMIVMVILCAPTRKAWRD